MLKASAQTMCEDIEFYFQQLSVNCKNISGKLIPAVKEHATTKVIAGMDHGQCSGTQAYTNDFVKFYSKKFDTPAAADSLYQTFKKQLTDCAVADGYIIQSQAVLDEADKIIRWNKTINKQNKTIVLELKPAPDGGFLVTLEFILS